MLRLRGGCSLFFVLVSCGHISFLTLFLCSTLTRIAQTDFYPIMYRSMHISCVGLCVHESDAELICMRFFFCLLVCFFSDVLTYCVMLQAFVCYCSFVRCFWCSRVCVCVVHWHCTAQLSMFNMEKRYRNKIIFIIIIISHIF